MIDYQAKDPQQQLLTSLVSPNRYQDLLSTPYVNKSFEEQKGFPVDGSLKQLRAYAPFIIEVIPPLIFTANVNTNDKKKKSSNLYTSSWKLNDSFSKAKKNLQEKVFRSNSFSKNQETRQKLDSEITSDGKKDGFNLFLTDAKQANDIATQLLGLLNAPPLVLLINPQSMNVQRAKIQQLSERTRNGYVFQAWGENQAQVSFECKIGAFYAGAYENTTEKTTTPSGVQWASRHNSASWQNLANVFQIYLNNGYIVDSVSRNFVHHMIGCIAVRYDQWVYLGNMKTFSFGYESSTSPNGGIGFSFAMSVFAIYDVAPFDKTVKPLKAPTQSPSSPVSLR